MAKKAKTEDTVFTTGANKHFRLKKEYKTMLSRIGDSSLRAGWKKMFIEAQLVEAEAGLKGRKGYLEMFKERA